MEAPEKEVIAIVHFVPVQGRPIFYQVTLDPKAVTKGGYIRFGHHGGDEITGWQPMASIEVDEILAYVEDDRVVPLADQPTITFQRN